MKAFLIGIILGITFQVYAQNELHVVAKENDKVGGRIAKGAFLTIKTLDGKKYEGSLIKVKAYTIELVRDHAVIDVDEIATLKVQTENGSFGLFPIGGFGVIYTLPKVSVFKAKYWKFFVKEG